MTQYAKAFLGGGTGGGAGSDTSAIHDDEAAEISAITDKATPVAADFLIIEDSAASDAKKSITIGNIPVNAAQVGDGSVTNQQYNAIPGLHGTGWLSGGTLSINADPTKFDLTAGTGVIVQRTDPTNPIYTPVSWGSFTAEDPTNLLTQSGTQIFMDSGGNIIQVNPDNGITDADNYRDFIHVGNVIHPSTTIISIEDVKPLASGPIEAANDIALALGALNKSGNVYSPNSGANLEIDKSAGVGYIWQSNTVNNPNNPSTATISATVTQSFIRAFQDGSGGFTGTPAQTDVDPDFYDDGSGTLAAVANNKFTAQRIFVNGVGSTAIQYGQNIYNSIAEAEAAVQGEVFSVNPAFQQLLFRCTLIVKKGTTDLTVSANAKFIAISKFGGAGGGGTTSTTNQQEAYDNSVDPEIVLSASPGGMSITDASSPIGVTLFEVQSNDRATDYLNVSAASTSVDNPFEVKEGNDLRLFDVGSSNYQGFKSPALTANQIWTLPTGDGSSGDVFTTNSSGVISWTTPSDTLATLALDNLASVAINTSLISDTNNTDDLGSDAIEWRDLWVHTIIHDDATNPNLNILTDGNNGDIIVAPDGTGTLNFVDGSEGTSGEVWTSTGTSGEGNWAAAAGGASLDIEAKAANFTAEDGKTYLVSSAAARAITMPAASSNIEFWVKDSTGDATTNNFTMTRAASESIEGLAANKVLSANWGSWHFICDGTNWFIL